MSGTMRLVTGPTSEPVTLAEAKLHLRVDIDDDDALIASLITAAREEFENQADKTLFTTTYKVLRSHWPGHPHIDLPRAKPLASVTSVTYTDENDVVNTFSSANYVVDTNAWPGRIVLRSDASWPSATLAESNPITITYVAGYASTASIPQRYKQAILLLVGHWYENREMVATSGAVPKSYPMAWDAIISTARWEER